MRLNVDPFTSPVFSIKFNHVGNPQVLAAGELYAAPRPGGFRDTPAGDLRELIREVAAGRPWREAVHARFAAANPWLDRIVTDPARTGFFGPVLPAGTGPALDLGAGWGQISRPLALSRPVVALEPVAERLAFIQAAARQDGVDQRIAFLEADYLEIDFTTRFEVICAIGVLEWAGAFQNAADPQERQRAFLRKTRRELAPGGSLVIGIENRLGLKYLLGCPDDHLGVSHVGYLPAELARRRWAEQGHTLQSFTYSQPELTALLRAAGFTQLEFFAAFPDYKLPRHIQSLADDGRALNDWLQREDPLPEHNGYNGAPLGAREQETLAAMYRSLAADGLAHHFVPSFFVRAG
ncbi:MAG: Methyltransferase domain protein [Verrucomicrobia bacterium]|nr:Methyltransferase domain protein [Verrucomicrobiota bacterium]